MAFTKGKSGNPNGRGSDKHWRDALLRAVKQRSGPENKHKLEQIATAVVDAAIAGDIQAAKEIGDRLDGKATQGVELGGPNGGPIVTSIAVEFVKPDEGEG